MRQNQNVCVVILGAVLGTQPFSQFIKVVRNKGPETELQEWARVNRQLIRVADNNGMVGRRAKPEG